MFFKHFPSTSPSFVPTCLPSGGFQPAAGEPVSDGAALQGLMGPPEGDRQARDEAPAEAEDVRLPQRLRREDHHPQDCSPQDHQQVIISLVLKTMHPFELVKDFPPRRRRKLVVVVLLAGSIRSCCSSVTRPTA